MPATWPTEKRSRPLQLLSETGFRDAQLITILRYRAACDLIALFCHLFHKFIIRQWLALVFILDTIHEGLLQLSCRDFLSFLILKTFRKEIF
mgnify:CR=1 FL=1